MASNRTTYKLDYIGSQGKQMDSSIPLVERAAADPHRLYLAGNNQQSLG
jgi:hypothetical protein